MEKTQVLFVDDEERLLSGLRRMLRDQRSVWDMHFVNSGKAALDLMATQNFDVVISDMRMPEMDGAQLLSIVQKEYPNTTRIILSGYAENETVLRTVGPSHQYLAKPCEPEVLKRTIEQALELRATLSSDELKQLVSGLKNVPSPSSTYQKFMSEIASPRATTESVAAVLSCDIGLAAQTLKLTNSAYFSLPQRISALGQAVKLLGFETIRSLVTLANFYIAFEGNAQHLKVLEILNLRSILIARLARKICVAEKLPVSEIDAAFCGGMLAHVGTLILVTNRPDKFDEAINLVEVNGQRIDAAERAVFGATHADLGAYLLGLWGFPDPVVEAVAFHHADTNSNGSGMTPALAVRIAQFVTRKINEERGGSERLIKSDIDGVALEAVGGDGRMAQWEAMFEEMIDG